MKWRGSPDDRNIEKLVALTEQEVEKAGVEGEKRLRFRYSLEEQLLRCQGLCGKETVIVLQTKRKGHHLTVSLTLPSECSKLQEDEDSPWVSLLSEWKTEIRRDRVVLIYSFLLQNTKADLFRFAWTYTKPHKWWFFLGVFSQAILVATQVIAPLIMAGVITALSGNALEQILSAAGLLLIISAISNAVSILCNRAYNVVYNKTITLLETDLVHQALKISSRCLDQKGTGLFIQRLTQDTAQLATGFNTLADLISQSIEKIGILVAILVINPIAFAAMMGILTVQTIIETIRTRLLKADDHIYRNANERYTGFISEMIRGAKDVKLTHSEQTFEDELVRRIRDSNDKRMKMQNRSAMFSLFRLEVGSFGTYGFIALLVLLMTRQSISPAQAVVLFNYRSNIGVSSIQLVGQLMEFVRGLELSAERVLAIINSPDFPKDSFGSRHLASVRGEIRFDHVFFTYRRRLTRRSPVWVLKDMSFTINPGESVALVGASGCGKSTIFNLICKLYEANEGMISLDSADIRELDDESIRGNMAVVTQNPYLFQLSIRENLRLVKPDMTEEDMREACRMACIDQDIEAMPEGYDTMIDENGVNLSGGQRQRLAIARALLKNSPILLLDEATSALDNITQARIQQAIANISGDKTVITIAHRMSTVIHADRILFVEQGRILDQGPHQELINRCEPYRRLYEAELGKV